MKTQKYCLHRNICIVTEIPTDGVLYQQSKKYVKCEDCNKILPIQRITTEEIKVPLIKTHTR